MTGVQTCALPISLTMKQMGYDNVSSMAQGIQGWADIDGEIED